MKYATLLLGLAIALASIATARARVIARCDYPYVKGGQVIVEDDYVPTCPASTPEKECLSVRQNGYTISNTPNAGFDIRIKTKTPRRGVSTSGPELVAVTLNGKSCRIDD